MADDAPQPQDAPVSSLSPAAKEQVDMLAKLMQGQVTKCAVVDGIPNATCQAFATAKSPEEVISIIGVRG